MVAEALAKIREGLDQLAGLPECDLGSEATVIELYGLRNRLESVVATATPASTPRASGGPAVRAPPRTGSAGNAASR